MVIGEMMTMTSLINYFHSINAWAHGLPIWGIACVMLIIAGVSKKMGLLVSIASGIAVWILFGHLWGLFYILAAFGLWIFLLILILVLGIFRNSGEK